MGVMDNILSKMQATPEFRPMSADTFADWSIEAGDILTVEVDGKDEVLPVFSSDLDWGGAAKSILSCSGSRERPTLSKQERQSYAAFGGMASEIKKAKDDALEDRNELIAALNGDDGAPEDLAAGLKNYVRYDLKNDESYAQSKLFAQVGDKAKAEIAAYVVRGSDGSYHSIASIVADIIKLRGDVKIVGNLSIEEGLLKSALGIRTNGDVYAHQYHSESVTIFLGANNSVTVNTKVQFNPSSIVFGGNTYEPTSITSTDGTEYTVLGSA